MWCRTLTSSTRFYQISQISCFLADIVVREELSYLLTKLFLHLMKNIHRPCSPLRLRNCDCCLIRSKSEKLKARHSSDASGREDAFAFIAYIFIIISLKNTI